MTLRLVDSGWSGVLTDCVRADSSVLRICCPFIKLGALDRLLAHRPREVRVVTRFNLNDFAAGVSDISALRRLLKVGAKVRGIRNLHSKMYLFGSSSAVVTSANLTSAALDRNQEFGIVATDASSIETCGAYFDRLWSLGRRDLIVDQLDSWDDVVTRHRAMGGKPAQGSRLPDHGEADEGQATTTPVDLPTSVTDAPQAFVKFLGEGSNRAPVTMGTLDEVQRSGCHWAVAYPASKRPRGVKDGAVIFISRLTRDPVDIRVFGRAIGLQHVPGRDDASAADIALRPWKATWSRYVRVDRGTFLAGTMANGVSLNELMSALGSNSFAPTQRNANSGEGNTDPRRAYLQQAAVELSDEGFAWLSARLEAAFAKHGIIPQDTLDQLDWPELPQ